MGTLRPGCLHPDQRVFQRLLAPPGRYPSPGDFRSRRACGARERGHWEGRDGGCCGVMTPSVPRSRVELIEGMGLAASAPRGRTCLLPPHGQRGRPAWGVRCGGAARHAATPRGWRNPTPRGDGGRHPTGRGERGLDRAPQGSIQGTGRQGERRKGVCLGSIEPLVRRAAFDRDRDLATGPASWRQVRVPAAATLAQ